MVSECVKACVKPVFVMISELESELNEVIYAPVSSRCLGHKRSSESVTLFLRRKNHA